MKVPPTNRMLALWLVSALLFLACAPSGPAPSSAPSSQPAAPKRVVVAIMGDPPNLYMQLAAGQNVAGGDALEELVSSGLGDLDNWNVVHPRLAEAVPTIDNGQWRIFSNGRMETTWRIRPGALWHDGAQITADDFVFTARVGQDRDRIISAHAAYEALEVVEAPDPRTVKATWKQPYIEADILFSHQVGLVLPKHLLERRYLEDKESFSHLPYWTQEFVGTGPFKVREFAGGSHVLLAAHDGYALGRPKIDEVEVKIIPDGNTLMANLLAGSVDLQLGRGLSFEQVMVLREQWRTGQAEVRHSGFVAVHPQLVNPAAPALTDVRFRRALLHALDRQQMADSLLGGQVPVAHVYLGPSEPGYPEIESAIVRYEYDPQRAAQIFEAIGYRRGADGGLRDRAAQRLALEIRGDPGDIQQKSMLATADHWQQAGIAVETIPTPPQLSRDREYGATHPAFRLRLHSTNIGSIGSFHSSRAPLLENRFLGSNYSRYLNADLDVLIDRYQTTIPKGERLQVLREAVRHVTDQAVVFGLFYNTEFTLIANRVQNVNPRKAASGSAQAWSAYQWDVK